MMRTAFAPGRVNLIGDHTDYTGGFALPVAINLGTTVSLEVGGEEVWLASDGFDEPATISLHDPHAEGWARYVAGVVAEVRPEAGGWGRVSTTLPVGAGLSSSAALEVSVALALGCTASPLDLALLCQRAEQRTSGVPSGVMDQLASTSGVAGHALLMDCEANTVAPVPIPDGLDIVAVHSGQPRELAGTAYAERRAACEAAAGIIGPLRSATVDDLAAISDPVVRRRARHVITENARTLAAADALRAGDADAFGQLMAESHASLASDFEVSTPALDTLVARLRGTSGVFGARLTGAGFGGCAVALTAPGVLDEGWRVRAVDGARPWPDAV